MKLQHIIIFVLFVLVALGGWYCLQSSDQTVTVNQQQLAELQQMLAEPKFVRNNLYPGLKHEADRLRVEAKVNLFLRLIVTELPQQKSRNYLVETLDVLLHSFDTEDSEECDQVAIYAERVLKILAVTDAGNILNRWRYGPFYWLLQR